MVTWSCYFLDRLAEKGLMTFSVLHHHVTTVLCVGCLVCCVLVSCGTHSAAQEAWVLMPTVYAQLGSCGREV